MKDNKTTHSTEIPPEQALLVQAVVKGEEKERAVRLLAELDHLARSAGLLVLGSRMPNLSKIQPATYLGKGTLAQLAESVEALEIGVVLFNNALTPVQQRNLERELTAKEVDRTG